MMKKCFAIATACLFLLLPTACAPEHGDPSVTGPGSDPVELDLWTFPVGGWGTVGTISPLITSFHQANKDIRVTVRVLDYVTGDSVIADAIEHGTLPDLVLEGPERLVADWGAHGHMVDIRDLWQNELADEIDANVRAACHDKDGNYYIYPLCMTTHCMAINRDLFEKADAWQYVDAEHHTWTSENFIKAVEALHDYGMERVAAVYCAGQGGDQGTRALVTNLFGGSFTDRDHTAYTVDSEENIRALKLLRDTPGIVFDKTLLGADAITRFCDGEFAMSFCWNVAIENEQSAHGNLDFDAFPMAFPTPEGHSPELQGGIWGFGIFDRGDEKRVEAAKTFIRYLTEEDRTYRRAVLASTYWPVREVPDIYANDELMREYDIFRQFLGDYYQITSDWAEARIAWWNMLQQIGDGKEVEQAVGDFSDRMREALANG